MYLSRPLSLSSVFRCWQNGSHFAQSWVILRKNGNKKAVSFLRDCYQFRLGGIAPGRAARSVIILETKRPIRFVLFQFTIMEVPHLPSA